VTATASPPGKLRVVIVIARYPPHHLGGYELRCRDVARELARRGHDVTVLTSRIGARGTSADGGVRVVRQLHIWPEGVQGRAQTLGFVLGTASDCRRLRRLARGADVVSYWHQSGLSSALLAVRPPKGCGVLCDVSSDWLRDSAGTGGNWFRVWEKVPASGAKRAAKAVIRELVGVFLGAPVRRPAFPPGRAYFTSEDRKRAYLEWGVAVEDAAVIRSGIDLGMFRFAEGRPEGPARVLFLGRIKRRKGLHTLVLAMGDLPAGTRLRAIGPVEDDAYFAEVAELADAARVMDRVEFGAAVPHSDVPGLLADAHVLVCASEEPEAFSRLVLEAFAVGTPVVGTTIGGTGDVLKDGDTGLAFSPGNARELSNQLQLLLRDPALRDRLVRNARKLVEERYSLGFTVDQIEALLRQAVAAARPEPPAE
jgi:glycosyltransferase involved in cell wall biosynthesis